MRSAFVTPPSRWSPPHAQRCGASGCVAADKSFVAFEAHGGRGRNSFLRIVRKPPKFPPIEPPRGERLPSKLTLAA
jgi:hypothetical protein